MTAIQLAFLAGLSLVMCAVAAFGALVIVGAVRGGPGAFVNAQLFRRVMRGSSDRAEVERWAFYAHRISGFAIFGFLCLHVLDVSLYAASSRLYGQVHQLYGNGLMRLFECGLLIAILFHTCNGIRVLVLDFAGAGTLASRRLLGTCLILTVALGLAGSVIILRPIVS